MVNYLDYAYLFGGLLLMIIWSIIFLARKDLRKEMVIVGTLFSIFALTGGFYNGLHWSPKRIFEIPYLGIGIEDFFYMFSMGGIGSVFYEFFFNKIHKKSRTKIKLEIRKIEILLAVVSGFVLIIYLEIFTNIGILLTHTFGLLLIASIFAFFDKRIVKPMILNSIAFGLLVVFVEVVTGLVFPGFREFWSGPQLIGIDFIGYPIEEFVFHAAWGAAVTCVYELYLGIKDE